MTDSDKINGSAWQDILAYRFLPSSTTLTGMYVKFKLNNKVENKCMLQLLEQESGRIVVQSRYLTLIPQQRMRSTANSSAGKRAQAAMDTMRIEYVFKVGQQPTGWILCLSDRFGQTCLSPGGPQTT